MTVRERLEQWNRNILVIQFFWGIIVGMLVIQFTGDPTQGNFLTICLTILVGVLPLEAIKYVLDTDWGSTMASWILEKKHSTEFERDAEVTHSLLSQKMLYNWAGELGRLHVDAAHAAGTNEIEELRRIIFSVWELQQVLTNRLDKIADDAGDGFRSNREAVEALRRKLSEESELLRNQLNDSRLAISSELTALEHRFLTIGSGRVRRIASFPEELSSGLAEPKQRNYPWLQSGYLYSAWRDIITPPILPAQFTIKVVDLCATPWVSPTSAILYAWLLRATRGSYPTPPVATNWQRILEAHDPDEAREFALMLLHTLRTMR